MADLEDNAAENDGGAVRAIEHGQDRLCSLLVQPEVVDHINAHEFIRVLTNPQKYIGALMYWHLKI